MHCSLLCYLFAKLKNTLCLILKTDLLFLMILGGKMLKLMTMCLLLIGSKELKIQSLKAVCVANFQSKLNRMRQNETPFFWLCYCHFKEKPISPSHNKGTDTIGATKINDYIPNKHVAQQEKQKQTSKSTATATADEFSKRVSPQVSKINLMDESVNVTVNKTPAQTPNTNSHMDNDTMVSFEILQVNFMNDFFYVLFFINSW